MKDKTKYLSFLFVFVAAIFLFQGCAKNNEDTVGADFLGKRGTLNVIFSDTSTITAYSAQHDSIQTQKLSYYMLGEVNDPAIGVARANIVSQFGLPVPQFWFGPTFTQIDSIVLQLAFVPSTSSQFFGNNMASQVINVYELDELMYVDTAYYSNKKFKYNINKPVGSWQGNFKGVGDSVGLTLAGIPYTLAPHIRIRLDDPDFIQKFVFAHNNRVFFDNDNNFVNYIKGLVMVPSKPVLPGGDGAIAYFDLGSSTTSMVVYYNGMFKAEFPIRSTSAKANSYSHVYNPDIQLQPLFGGTHKDYTYLEPLAGIKTRIFFPNLFKYVENQRIAITGAEMVFSIKDGSNYSPYLVPANIRLLSSDSVGHNDLITDYFMGASYYGGTFDQTKGEYRFNITRHMQNIFNQYKNAGVNINYGLNLMIPGDAPITANRVLLDTRNLPSGRKIKLNLSYIVVK